MSFSRKSMFLVLSLLGTVAACGGGGGGSSGPATAGISYAATLSLATDMIFDSVTYDGGHGTMVKVNTPAPDWTYTFSTTIPASVEAHLYGHATNPGSAKIKVTWTTTGGTFSDSGTVIVSSATVWHADLPHHSI